MLETIRTISMRILKIAAKVIAFLLYIVLNALKLFLALFHIVLKLFLALVRIGTPMS